MIILWKTKVGSRWYVVGKQRLTLVEHSDLKFSSKVCRYTQLTNTLLMLRLDVDHLHFSEDFDFRKY